MREICFIQRMVGMAGQGRMIDPLDLRVAGEIFNDPFGIFRMTVEAKGQGFNTLQQQESVKR